MCLYVISCNMYRATTNNIIIEVLPKYEDLHSNPSKSHFVFSYRILIINQGDNAVKLLKRHWIIKSADGILRDVEGDGVVGQQPVLKPGDSFQYNSWAPITCEIGEMFGSFLMKNLEDDSEFQVQVPKFQFIADPLLN